MRFCVLGLGCFWSRVSLEMSSGDGSNERLFMDDGRHFSEREAARGFWVLSFCVLLGLFRQHGGAWPIVYPEFLPCVCFMKIFFLRVAVSSCGFAFLMPEMPCRNVLRWSLKCLFRERKLKS